MPSAAEQPPPEPASPLGELFARAEEGSAGIRKRFRIIRRHGELLLALPIARSEATTTLQLYAPQRPAARAASGFLKLLLRIGLPVPLPVKEFHFTAADPFCEFLSQLEPAWSACEAGLGVLAGNPHARGRRFVLMLFKNGRVVAVVKAGVGSEARCLIASEITFLQSAGRPGIAAPLAEFDSSRVRAFAMAPLDGEAPRHPTSRDIHRVLLPWLNQATRVPLSELASWARVAAACADHPAWRAHCASVATCEVFPAVAHGDFAPWNIKVHPESGAWQVFDWERGEIKGVPGWDWMHFEIQNAILVWRDNAETILKKLDHLFSDSVFCDYAKLAGFAGIERALLVAYLLHCAFIQPPTEGLASVESLLQALCTQ
jgi:hypothetical protein